MPTAATASSNSSRNPMIHSVSSESTSVAAHPLSWSVAPAEMGLSASLFHAYLR